jgi:ABC-type phosphate transport system substrate-binding protein
VVPIEGTAALKQATMRDLLRWMLTDGQKQCQSLGYVRLPPDFARRELQVLANLN